MLPVSMPVYTYSKCQCQCLTKSLLTKRFFHFCLKKIAALVMSIGKRELAVLRPVYVPCLCLAHLLLDEVDT
jgi:hypothetical protein